MSDQRLASSTAAAIVMLLAIIGGATEANGSTCTDRSGWLRDAERGIRAELGDLTRLDDEADLTRLAAKGYGFYPHHRVSVRDMGWAVVDSLVPHDPVGVQPIPERPSALVFRPSGTEVFDAHDSFDFPYELAGWAYFFPFSFGSAPTTVVVDGRTIGDFSCIERREWFVHEKGIHRFSDGGMTTVPPDEEIDGTAPGVELNPVGPEAGDFRHSRAWDVHVWLTDGDPVVSMLAPVPILGIDPHVGTVPPGPDEPDPWFFYPQRAADLSVSITESTDPVRARGSVTYTITVVNSGPDAATEVTLTDVVSKGGVPVAVSPSQGTCSLTKQTVTCATGSLALGANWTLTIDVLAVKTGVITTSASVVAGTLDLKEKQDPADGWEDGSWDNAWTESTGVIR